MENNTVDIATNTTNMENNTTDIENNPADIANNFMNLKLRTPLPDIIMAFKSTTMRLNRKHALEN
jgi:hypothetical protein